MKTLHSAPEIDSPQNTRQAGSGNVRSLQQEIHLRLCFRFLNVLGALFDGGVEGFRGIDVQGSRKKRVSWWNWARARIPLDPRTHLYEDCLRLPPPTRCRSAVVRGRET